MGGERAADGQRVAQHVMLVPESVKMRGSTRKEEQWRLAANRMSQ